MATEAQMEVLSGALDSALRAEATVKAGDLSSEAVRREIHTTNVLLDACIEAGMSHDEADHVGWAAVRVGQWLTAGVEA